MSTCRYGDGTLYGAAGLTYGAAAVDRPVTWMFEVDWDNDGIFNGENEGLNLYSISVEAGRQFFVQSGGQGFEPVAPSKGTFLLRNFDGRYDPFNLGGPLAGMIQPGRKCRVRVQNEADGSRQDVLVGRLTDIRPIYGEVDSVKVDVVNAVDDLKRTIRTTVRQSIRYDAAVQACLDAFGWTDGTNIDTTVSEAMEYWWASGKSAFAEIQSITDAALGMFCIGEDGKAVYKSRISGETPLMTITDEDILDGYGVRTPMPWETIFNVIRVYARKRTLQTNVTLWQMTDVPLVPAGESREIWATFSINGEEAVALSVTAPVSTTDYTGNSAQDGSGSNLTGNLVVTVTTFATSAKFVVQNNGATGAYITLLKLRGNAIVADKYTYVEREDAGSKEAFGERELVVKSDWLQDLNTARDEADILRSRLASQRAFPRFKMYDNFGKQFGIRLFGLVLVDFATKGISGEYRFGYYRHVSVDESCYTFETEVYLEPNLLGNVSGTWVFPAVFGVTTVF